MMEHRERETLSERCGRKVEVSGRSQRQDGTDSREEDAPGWSWIVSFQCFLLPWWWITTSESSMIAGSQQVPFIGSSVWKDHRRQQQKSAPSRSSLLTQDCTQTTKNYSDKVGEVIGYLPHLVSLISWNQYGYNYTANKNYFRCPNIFCIRLH